MVGLLIIILVSWLLLNFLDKTSIESLGLLPKSERIKKFSFGLLISIICCLIYFGSLILLSKSSLTINKDYGLFAALNSLGWTTKSVLFEEFLFRGVLLYFGIKYFGAKTACIISAIAFGVYHWFSYNIFGNVGQMIPVFILTFVAGLLFAHSFVKTKSMYLQIGLHLGWNIVTIIVFSQGPLGQQYLIASNGQQIGILMTLVLFAFQLLALPILTLFYLNTSLKLK
ncbi:MAG: CPBP family intramembrane metalloprotease [Chitinophagaceae bacterium BSSC1]|nr:MAG: CPBP family intramembrane metalloprotease [Chitinophagaceae bacterium BSSC1]